MGGIFESNLSRIPPNPLRYRFLMVDIADKERYPTKLIVISKSKE